MKRPVPLRSLLGAWAVAVTVLVVGLSLAMALYEGNGDPAAYGEHTVEAGALALGVLALYLALDRFVVGPLRVLRQAVEAMRRDDWTRELPAYAVRELDELAREFESMSRELAGTLARLSESEQRFRALTESAPDAIVTVRSDGTIDQFNQAAERLFGYGAAEVRAKPLSLLLDPEATRHHDRHLADYAMEPAEGSRRMHAGRLVRARRRDGQPLSLEIGVSKSRAGGELIFTAMIRDVSDRVQAEAELEQYRRHLESLVEQRTAELSQERDRAQAATRSKTEFLANMSHELRTPLNAIIGLGHLARRSAEGDQAKHLDRLTEAAGHLAELLNDILDLSRLEAGSLALAERDSALQATVLQVARMLAESAAQKGLELVPWLDAAVPAMVHVDELRLRQVLLNLVGNAVKFTEQGHITLRVRLLGRDGDQQRLRFEVSDTGIGMPDEVLQELGQPFQQADQSTTKSFAGTGLGLAICRRVLHLMGSSLEVRSQPGRGTTCWFDLSLKAVPAAAAQATETIEGLRVLVVEDLDDARAAHTAHLDALGCRAQAVGSAKEALLAIGHAEAAGEPFEACLLGSGRSCGEGFELGQRIRATARRVPPRLVLLSQGAQQASDQELQAAGFAALAIKPIGAGGLAAALAKAQADGRMLQRAASGTPVQAAAAPEEHAQARADGVPRSAASPGSELPTGDRDEYLERLASHWSRMVGLRADIGMRMTRGDPVAYGRLLQRFAQSHRDDPAHLHAMAARNQVREAFELAHALKSTAGAVGALQLAAAAAQVPAAAAEGAEEPARERIVALADALDRVLAEVARVLEEAPREPATRDNEAANGDGPDRLALRTRLLELLERRDMASLRYVRDNEAAIRSRCGSTLGPAIVLAVHAFDYDKALELLRAVPASAEPQKSRWPAFS